MSTATALILKSPQIRIIVLALLGYSATIASTIPYQSVIGIKELGISNQAFAAFMFAGAIVNVAAAVSLGALSDLVRNRKPLVMLLAACGIAGYGMVYLVPTKLVFILAMLTLIPMARAAFSLLFGSVRHEMRDATPDEVTAVNSTVRATYAASWVVIPGLVGWWLASAPSLIPAFLIASLAALFTFFLYGLFGHPAPTTGEKKSGFLASLRLIATAPVMIRVLIIAIGSGAHTLHSTLHPLIMTGPAHGTTRDVGIYAGLLAGLEIPFMLFWSRVARARSTSFALTAALLVYALYAVLMSFATAPWHLYAIAILNSCGAAAVLSLPISAFQDMLKDRPGLATSLVPVMTFTGSMIGSAGFAFGTWVSDYSGTALVIVTLCLAGAAGLFLTERRSP